jgi:hypothetical protein
LSIAGAGTSDATGEIQRKDISHLMFRIFKAKANPDAQIRPTSRFLWRDKILLACLTISLGK